MLYTNYGLHFYLLASMVWNWQWSDRQWQGSLKIFTLLDFNCNTFLLTSWVIFTVSLIYCSCFASRAACSASKRSSTWSARWAANFLFVSVLCRSVPLILQCPDAPWLGLQEPPSVDCVSPASLATCWSGVGTFHCLIAPVYLGFSVA
jgi:hypothetical protein